MKVNSIAFASGYFKNPSNNLCPLDLNFDSSKASLLLQFLECGRYMHVILCFMKYNNPYFHKGLHPPHLFCMHYIMLNKNTLGTKKARPIRSSSYLTIHATTRFDIS